MSRRRRPRQVEIFNFSFLDILACTIGLLIFIMVMVFILQSGSPVADTGAIVVRKLREASLLRTDAERDTQIAGGLEAQFDQVRVPEMPDLTRQRDAARSARDEAQANYDQAIRQVASAQAQLDDARLTQDRAVAATLERAKTDLKVAADRHSQAEADLARLVAASKETPVVLSPYRRPGSPAEDFQVLHVDCRADGVVLLETDGNRKITQVGHTSANNLDDVQSDYQHTIASHAQLDHPLVLFWVRPDGVTTFTKAREQLPSGTPFGFEPANADWIFETVSP